MKRKQIFIFLTFFLLNNAFSIEIGQKIYKKIRILENKEYIWLKCDSIEKYNSKGNIVSSNSIFHNTTYNYGDNGLLIYSKFNDDYEEWEEFNSSNQLIHRILSDGYEEWYEYDAEGRMILCRGNNGFINQHEYKKNYYKWYMTSGDGRELCIETYYNDEGKVIYMKDKETEYGITNFSEEKNEYTENSCKTIKNHNGEIEECIIEYDKKGNEIHWKNDQGEERYTEYNLEGNPILIKGIEMDEGKMIEFSIITEYDELGRKVHTEYSNGYEEWWEYYSDNKLKVYHDNKGSETYKRDDKKGLEYKNENRREYDSKGNLIYNLLSNGYGSYYEYDYYPNGIIRTKVGYEFIK